MDLLANIPSWDGIELNLDDELNKLIQANRGFCGQRRADYRA